MNNGQVVAPDGNSPEAKTARDYALAVMFQPGELVWQLNEVYDSVANTWNVDVVRMGPYGRWMRQRYTYDVLRGVIYFFGERPLDDAELATIKREGKIVQKGDW